MREKLFPSSKTVPTIPWVSGFHYAACKPIALHEGDSCLCYKGEAACNHADPFCSIKGKGHACCFEGRVALPCDEDVVPVAVTACFFMICRNDVSVTAGVLSGVPAWRPCVCQRKVFSAQRALSYLSIHPTLTGSCVCMLPAHRSHRPPRRCPCQRCYGAGVAEARSTSVSTSESHPPQI